MGYDDSSEQLALASAGYCKTEYTYNKNSWFRWKCNNYDGWVKSGSSHSLAQQEVDMLWLH